MKADGSAPRRLARPAHCPSWSADGRRVYYHVWYNHRRPDGTMQAGRWLYAIPIDGSQTQPVAISPCISEFPAVAPPGDYLADLDGGAEKGAVLRIMDVETRACIAEWATPLESPTTSWSPDGRELSFGGLNGIRARTGLWIYDLASQEGVKVLSGHFSGAVWSPDHTRLLISVGKPFWEIWVADLDPALSTAESLGPAQTLEEHCLESIATCTRDLDVDPGSFVNRWTRAISALWIGHPQTPAYLEEIDLHLGRPPFRPSLSNCHSARNILVHPALYERLGDLAWILARRAVQQQPRHADELVPLFEGIGQHERAGQLRQIAQADTLKGGYRYDRGSDTYTVVSCGAGIAGATDEFHFVYNYLEGDGSITARVESINDVHAWAKAGVMVRANLDPDAAFAAILATPGSGVSYHIRSTTGGRVTTDDHVATPEQTALRAPVWIRLEREGDHFSAFTSSDGVTWTPIVWGPQQVSMPPSVYIGLAVTSHDRRRTAEARISHVTTSGEVGFIGHLKRSQDVCLQLPPPPQ